MNKISRIQLFGVLLSELHGVVVTSPASCLEDGDFMPTSGDTLFWPRVLCFSALLGLFQIIIHIHANIRCYVYILQLK
jgi:hypothetical protein